MDRFPIRHGVDPRRCGRIRRSAGLGFGSRGNGGGRMGQGELAARSRAGRCSRSPLRRSLRCSSPWNSHLRGPGKETGFRGGMRPIFTRLLEAGLFVTPALVEQVRGPPGSETASGEAVSQRSRAEISVPFSERNRRPHIRFPPNQNRKAVYYSVRADLEPGDDITFAQAEGAVMVVHSQYTDAVFAAPESRRRLGNEAVAWHFFPCQQSPFRCRRKTSLFCGPTRRRRELPRRRISRGRPVTCGSIFSGPCMRMCRWPAGLSRRISPAGKRTGSISKRSTRDGHRGHQRAAGCFPGAPATLRRICASGQPGYGWLARGGCPAHGLTTLYYLVRKHASKADAETAMDRVLRHFQIGNLDAAGWQEARQLPFADFEDAAVATVAKATESSFIVTRNVDDFANSPVPAITPTDFLSQHMLGTGK